MSAYFETGKRIVILALAVTLFACSTTDDTEDYKGVYAIEKKQNKPLEVPPDLVLPRGELSLSVPSIAAEQASMSSYNKKDPQNVSGLLADATGARLKHDGGIRWLEVDLPAEKIWLKLKPFFKALGFEIITDDLQLGLLVTDWKENRAEFPSSWLGKLFNSFSESSVKDKYRVRLERAGENKTLLFVTHQGLKAGTKDDVMSDTTSWYWEARDADPELEAEIMLRFLVFTGMQKQQASAIVNAEQHSLAELVENEQEQYLKVSESFPRTWRRVGLALDRLGLPVEDRNRSAGVYYFTLSKEFKAKEDKGWFASMFSGDDKDIENALLLKLDEQNEVTTVYVRGRKGTSVDKKLVKLVLTELQQYLR
ncbi:MAG: outer membrane protein assembly factor BamC [Gammaproteobacteria bacterium]|nr:outer membrane protein assembly factor BamC [Gammaproteobacteria bacterium]